MMRKRVEQGKYNQNKVAAPSYTVYAIKKNNSTKKHSTSTPGIDIFPYN
jgi:hypothetical protein